MRIEKVTFKNFNGFGDQYYTIDFNNVNGLMLLYGLNGSGKTTILEVITFAIYGRIPNKKKAENVVNRYNKNLETEIDISAKNRTIKIKRNLSPDLFEIYENGKPLDYAYKKSKQKYLENEILGIPYDIFNNIVSLSISDFKSFTKRLSAKDKQNIVDRIFGIEFISKMYLINKEKISEKRNEINLLNKSISELNLILNETQEKINNKIKINESKIESEKTEYSELLNEVNNSLKSLTSDLSKLTEEKEKFTSKLQDANTSYLQLESELKVINKNIKLYNNNQCPTCKGDLTTDDHKNHLAELKEQKLKYEEKVNEFNEFHNNINKKINETQLKIDNFNKNINIENNKLFEIQFKLSQLNKTQESDDLQVIVQETASKIKKYNNENQLIGNELQILRILNEILNENGVKRVLLSRIIPSFNLEVKKILDSLGINFKVNINDKFVTTITHLGKEVPIDTLSTGQLKKIDIAIILTFIKILKTKFSSLNILFLDEIFASVDIEGRYGILTILKDLSDKYNINILVVNHSEMPSELFCFNLKTSVKDNFSELEIEKIM